MLRKKGVFSRASVRRLQENCFVWRQCISYAYLIARDIGYPEKSTRPIASEISSPKQVKLHTRRSQTSEPPSMQCQHSARPPPMNPQPAPTVRKLPNRRAVVFTNLCQITGWKLVKIPVSIVVALCNKPVSARQRTTQLLTGLTGYTLQTGQGTKLNRPPAKWQWRFLCYQYQ